MIIDDIFKKIEEKFILSDCDGNFDEGIIREFMKFYEFYHTFYYDCNDIHIKIEFEYKYDSRDQDKEDVNRYYELEYDIIIE